MNVIQSDRPFHLLAVLSNTKKVYYCPTPKFKILGWDHLVTEVHGKILAKQLHSHICLKRGSWLSFYCVDPLVTEVHG
jgi:hypothetical protein